MCEECLDIINNIPSIFVEEFKRIEPTVNKLIEEVGNLLIGSVIMTTNELEGYTTEDMKLLKSNEEAHNKRLCTILLINAIMFSKLHSNAAADELMAVATSGMHTGWALGYQSKQSMN